MGEESSPDQGAASQQKEAAYNDREPDSLEQALLAAANELSPLQKADLIAYARQLSGAIATHSLTMLPGLISLMYSFISPAAASG